MRAHDADGARELYARALALEPGYAEASFDAARLELVAGNLAEARDLASSTLAATPAHPGALLLFAQTLLQANRARDTPAGGGWLRGEGPMGARGSSTGDTECGETEEYALSLAQRAVALAPDDPAVLIGMGGLLLSAGRGPAVAARYFGEAVRAAPNEGRVLKDAAMLLLLHGAEALEGFVTGRGGAGAADVDSDEIEEDDAGGDGGVGKGGQGAAEWRREAVALLRKAVVLRPLDYSVLGACRDLLNIEEAEAEAHESARAQERQDWDGGWEVDEDRGAWGPDELLESHRRAARAEAGGAGGDAGDERAAVEVAGGELVKGASQSWLERYEWVETLYVEALYERPDDAALLCGCAQLLTGPGMRVDASDARRMVNTRRGLEMLVRALALAPRSGKLHLEFARVQSRLEKNYELAREHYMQAMALLRGDAHVCFEAAKLLHHNLREYREAETLYQKCLSKQPMHVQAMVQYGYLLLHALNRPASARRLLARARELVPDDAEAKLGLSMVELLQMELNEGTGAEPEA